MKEEDREAKAAVWLQRLRAAAAAKEPLVEYARRHGLRPGEAYRWRENLRHAGQWPARSANAARASRATEAAGTGAPRFARVRIAAERSALSSGWAIPRARRQAQTRRCRCAGVTCVHLPTLRLALCSGNCAARDDDSVAPRRVATSVALEITAGTTTHSARTAQTHSAHGDRESDLE